MATNTAGTVAQAYHTNQTHYLIKAIAYTMDGTSVSMGFLPAGAVITNCYGVISTAFNGGATNTLSIGKSGSTTIWANAIALGTAGRILSTTLATATTVVQAADVEVLATVTSTAGASAGAGYAILEYMIPQ